MDVPVWVAVALSTIGQLVIHLTTMVVAVQWTRAATTGNEVRFASPSRTALARSRLTLRHA
jgi:hypothetical protein